MLKFSDLSEHAVLMELNLERQMTTCAPKFGFFIKVMEGEFGALAFVHNIKSKSPAANAGLLMGDVIYAVNRVRVRTLSRTGLLLSTERVYLCIIVIIAAGAVGCLCVCSFA